MYDENKLLEFRKQKDLAWKNDAGSPLTQEQKKNFTGLSYFPPNSGLSFESDLDKNVPNVGSKVIIKTTGGDEQIYSKAGKIKFKVESQDVEAIVLEDPEQEQFQSTGTETYKNGRMLQIPKRGDKLAIGFNYSYNPYSSYNDNGERNLLWN